MKWQDIVVHKNVFSDCVKYVAMPYHTLAQWVKVFWEGRDAIQDNLRRGRPHVKNNTVQLLASLLDAHRQRTARELAVEVGVCHKTMLHILHNIMDYHKLPACWIPHEISKMQQWHCYAVVQALLDQYQREGDYFLGRIIAMDEIWAYSYKPNLKCQSNEWKHSGSPHPKKVCPTQCAVKVIFIVA